MLNLAFAVMLLSPFLYVAHGTFAQAADPEIPFLNRRAPSISPSARPPSRPVLSPSARGRVFLSNAARVFPSFSRVTFKPWTAPK